MSVQPLMAAVSIQQHSRHFALIASLREGDPPKTRLNRPRTLRRSPAMTASLSACRGVKAAVFRLPLAAVSVCFIPRKVTLCLSSVHVICAVGKICLVWSFLVRFEEDGTQSSRPDTSLGGAGASGTTPCAPVALPPGDRPDLQVGHADQASKRVVGQLWPTAG